MKIERGSRTEIGFGIAFIEVKNNEVKRVKKLCKSCLTLNNSASLFIIKKKKEQ
ncbi:MAG: hypothetical protein JETT_0023 [Candidatus Jettenia ecosi]|uniref:Uncharacterized protein n=1 Tax=Candidatus Jettenia ecosi TaxID=2494326 RepID=A0A533QG27_9BACT|nr:MAG: hypothetical protein JETT_0023 [Candidatus Jettenia ecosi]